MMIAVGYRFLTLSARLRPSVLTAQTHLSGERLIAQSLDHSYGFLNKYTRFEKLLAAGIASEPWVKKRGTKKPPIAILAAVGTEAHKGEEDPLYKTSFSRMRVLPLPQYGQGRCQTMSNLSAGQ